MERKDLINCLAMELFEQNHIENPMSNLSKLSIICCLFFF